MKKPPKMVNGRDVADPDVRRCLSCMLRCQGDEMVCKGCGCFVSLLWPPPGSPRAAHSKEKCRSARKPFGCSTGPMPCWVPPRMRVVK